MKALSVRAPWWWAILNGKPVENRDWYTSQRGRVYIHASKFWKIDEISADHFREFHQELNGGAILKDAGRRVRETARQWNRLADQTPGLPHVDFTLPKKREP